MDGEYSACLSRNRPVPFFLYCADKRKRFGNEVVPLQKMRLGSVSSWRAGCASCHFHGRWRRLRWGETHRQTYSHISSFTISRLVDTDGTTSTVHRKCRAHHPRAWVASTPTCHRPHCGRDSGKQRRRGHGAPRTPDENSRWGSSSGIGRRRVNKSCFDRILISRYASKRRNPPSPYAPIDSNFLPSRSIRRVRLPQPVEQGQLARQHVDPAASKGNHAADLGSQVYLSARAAIPCRPGGSMRAPC
jgi:hypothetical protein